MKKLFLAWVGQNATTGAPNPLTGRMNKYGTLHVFSSQKLRDKFCDQYDYSFNCYPVPTNKKEAKSLYCAGQSQYNFDRDLLCTSYSDDLVIDK